MKKNIFILFLIVCAIVINCISCTNKESENPDVNQSETESVETVEADENKANETEPTENTESSENEEQETESTENAEPSENEEQTTEPSENEEKEPDTPDKNDNNGVTENEPTENEELGDTFAYFKDGDELLSYFTTYFGSKNRGIYGNGVYIDDTDSMIYYSADVVKNAAMDTAEAEAVPEATAAADFNGDVSQTNVQTEGIDEGDIVKTDGKYIYILRNNELIIVGAGEKTEVLSYYKVFPEGDGFTDSLYIKGDKAIVVATIYRKSQQQTNDTSSETDFGSPINEIINSITDFIGNNGKTEYVDTTKTYSAVYVIDISDRKKPVEISSTFIEGDLLDSRENNGKIYLVANKYLAWYSWSNPDLFNILPSYIENGTEKTAEASEIAYLPYISDPSSQIMSVAIINCENGEIADSMSVLGTGTNIYMTSENLYIIGSAWYGIRGTTVAKYSVSDTINYVASVQVPGYASTDFSYNEYNGKFRIATTSYDYSEYSKETNNVYVYDENLTEIGKITGLAEGESIKSVRFMNDIAYVVTFRQVDPLFVIDLSENTPKVLGELKVPGFSTYLHPVSDGLLLGIGNETKDNAYTDENGEYHYYSTYISGMKISLFDVSDPMNPTEVDVANYVGGDYASADAQNNYKAFVYSSSTNTGYFAFDEQYGYSNGFYQEPRCGIVVVSINDGKLDVKTVYPSEFGTYSSYDSRVIFIENNLYLYQYNRLFRFDRTDLTEKECVVLY